jgi:hypothetical protein
MPQRDLKGGQHYNSFDGVYHINLEHEKTFPQHAMEQHFTLTNQIVEIG